MLMRKFLEWCRTNGATRATAVSSFRNEQAIGFYKKSGFREYNLRLEMDL
jgi:GNAT superfamily N-acetyltransferase